MRILVVGGCGFLGSNLASYGLDIGHDITVFDNLSRLGAPANLAWLQQKRGFRFVHGDTRNRSDVENCVRQGRFDAIFHLAGQVAMTTSLENPYKDFQTNTMGAIHVLEAVRKTSPDTAVFFSSTNKVYGELEQYTYTETATRYQCRDYPCGFDESVPLDFRSPYGCSKGAADQYMLDYYRMFGVRTVVFRHSSMYGSRQFATSDQGWIGWFCQQAVHKSLNPRTVPFTISGNGKQVRDILHAEDMISLYYTALDNADRVCGQAYNVGGTMEQSLSLLELFALLEEMLSVKLSYTMLPPRISDQKVFVANIAKIQSKIDWRPRVSSRKGIEAMVAWIREKEAK